MLYMPIKDGRRLTSEIRAVDRSVPIIILTAFDSPENHVKLTLEGATRFLSKKTELPQLEFICRELLLMRGLDEATQTFGSPSEKAVKLLSAVRKARRDLQSGRASLADQRLRAIEARFFQQWNEQSLLEGDA